MENQAKPLQFLGIGGSLRKDAYSGRLLDWLIKNAPSDVKITRYQSIGDLPHFNQDFEAEGNAIPDSVNDFRRAVLAADGVIIFTPEYNYNVSGVLKNAVDWLSRPPGQGTAKSQLVMTVSSSVSPGGGMRAQAKLRESLDEAIGAVLVGEPVGVPAVHGKFSEEGILDPEVQEQLRASLAGLISAARSHVPEAV